MKLYRWISTTPPHQWLVAAMGRDAAEARVNARAAEEIYLRDLCSTLTAEGKIWDIETMVRRRRQFYEVTDKEPTEARHGAVLVRGSD